MSTSHDTPMSPEILSLADKLSDQELLARVKLLAHREREVTAVLIAHLAVLDDRRLYLAEGCSSLFTYCTQVLHLSENAAYGRIEAARTARKYPVILELLSDGSVNLTTVGLLAPHLTSENHRDLLETARHHSKRQVEELVARLRPQPPMPSTIRRLPSANHVAVSHPVLAAGAGSQSASNTVGSSLGTLELSSVEPGIPVPPAPAATPAAPSPARPAIVAPLSPERYRVQFTVNAETYAKLRLAQDLLRHQIPDGDLEQIIDRALTALLEDVAKQKFAATNRPSRNTATDHPRGNGSRGDHGTVAHSRHIPAEVKRAVWLRDGGRCAFVAHNGRRCTERGFLEFHHVVPHSAGGEATVDNIELRCRTHNGYEAELYFGRRMCLVDEPAPYLHALKRRTLGSPLRTMPSTRSGPSGRPDAEPP